MIDETKNKSVESFGERTLKPENWALFGKIMGNKIVASFLTDTGHHISILYHLECVVIA